MKNQRSLSLEFKRQVVEELLSGDSRPAQLCRRYNISPSLLYHWKRLWVDNIVIIRYNAELHLPFVLFLLSSIKGKV